MRIVGVGQMFNFQTGQMEDRIQVISADGESFSIPTTNEGAQILVKKAMSNGHRPLVEEEDDVQRAFGEHTESDHQPLPEDVPGADVFGGDEGEPSEEQVAMFQHTLETKRRKTASLGVRKNPPDRSGVPSHGIARVDEMGNPMLPEAPDAPFDDYDEEDDPGEQI